VATPPSIDALRNTVSDLVALTAGRTPRELLHVPRGEWSAGDVVAHIADNEMVYGVRIRMVLTDENPMLVGYDEQAWSSRLQMADLSTAGAIERFRVVRDSNIRLLESLEVAEWSRRGKHVDKGELTMGDIVELLVGHDRTHLDRIRKLLP